MSQPSITPTPILWIVGSVGTGKSDTSYHLFSWLFRAGTPTARLDLDDVGMCHPTPKDDPDNHGVKAAAWSVYQANRATCFVVSGGVNAMDEVELHKRQIPDAEWTIVRLRISADERRRRTAVDPDQPLPSRRRRPTPWWKRVLAPGPGGAPPYPSVDPYVGRAGSCRLRR